MNSLFDDVPDVAPSESNNFFSDVPDLGTQNVKARVYGPVVGEHHHDAMFGPNKNPLGETDVALSPDLLEVYPLGSQIKSNGKEYTVADVSYVKPGHPNINTIEFRDNPTPPERVTISPISGSEMRNRIGEFPKVAGEVTGEAATEAGAKRVPNVGMFGDVPSVNRERPSGTPSLKNSMFSDIPNAGAKIDESPTPTVTPDEEPISPTPTGTATPTDTPPPQVGPTPMPPPHVATGGVTLPQVPIPQQASVENNLIPTPLPAPQVPQEPDIMTKALRAGERYVGEMIPPIPGSFQQGLLQGAGLDPSDPFSLVGTLVPPVKPMISEAFHALHRIQQIQEAEQSPPWSQPRFDAGIGTVLDLMNLAAVGGGFKTGMRSAEKPQPRVQAPISTHEIPGVQFEQSRGEHSTGIKPVSEKIVAAGIRDKNTGEIWTGPSHPSIVGDIPNVESRTLDRGGFVTDAGRYITDQKEIDRLSGKKGATAQKIFGQFLSPEEVAATKSASTGVRPVPPATPPPIPPQPPSQPPPVPKGYEKPNPVRGSGPFFRSYRVDKRLGELMDGIGAAPEHGAILAETKYRNLTDGLSTAQSTDLFRYLTSERLKTVNKNHPQILDGLEEIRIERDPAIAKALKYYESDIKPEIESWRKRAGLSEKAAAGKSPIFISLIPKTDVLLGENPAVGKVSRMSRTTRFAKAASGLAQEYSVNGADILRESYTESIRKALTRELYDTAERKGVAQPSRQFMPDPANGENAGKWVSVVKDTDLPNALQTDLAQIVKNTAAPEGAEKWLRDYQKFATGIALTANPAELMNHMRRQLNLVAAKPPIGQGLIARLEWLVPYFGPKIGTAKRALMRNASSPEFQKTLTDLTAAGGGSTRAFYERYHVNAPGIKEAQAWSNDLLFGIPKGKGAKGFDLRMRVALEDIRKAAEPALANDPQRMRENANQIGEYGSQVSWPIKALRTLNPYAATTLRMRVTELKTALGLHGFQGGNVPTRVLHWAETQLRGTGGTIIMLATANKLLSGHWPWENEKGHEFDIDMGIHDKDGKPIHLKLRAVAPELSRPIDSLSIPNVLRERGAKHPQYGSAALTGPANQVASMVTSPGLNLGLAAGPQVAPYFLREPGEQGMELMKTGRLSAKERKAGKSAELRRAQSILSTINPLGELFGPNYRVEVPGALGYLEEPIPGIRPFGTIFSTSYEKKSHDTGGLFDAVPPAPPPPPPP